MSAFDRGTFSWALGIEDTCVYPAEPGATPLDEHELTDHNRVRAADLALAAQLGATALRYGASWPVVHVAPGTFVWDQLDEAVDHAERLGLELVVDLVHYGTPTWLTDSFADPGYPAAIEEFTRALVSRYRGRVRHLTPLNEPLTTASFCGLRGVWPPHRTGWEGWVAVVVPMALGAVRTARAAREIDPEVRIVHVEASTLVTAADPLGTEHAELLRNIGWLATDLMLGRVAAAHPMRGWLLDHGAREADLDWLTEHAAAPDVMGVNYYPDLTPRQVHVGPDGPVQVVHDRWTEGLAEALHAFADRYGLPLAICETSIEGDDELRSRWLRESAALAMTLRAEGLDLRGYTWWPLLDFVDWSWSAGGANVEEFAVQLTGADGSVEVGHAAPLGDPAQGKEPFLRRMGIVRLDEAPDGTLTRTPTAAAELYASVVRS